MKGGLNRRGSPCPECGFNTHRAAFNGEIRLRCTMNDCPRGWYHP